MLQRLFSGKEALARLPYLELLLKEKDARLQEKDARLQEMDSLVNFFLKEKNARLQDALLQDKNALLQEKDVRLQEKVALMNYRLKLKDARLQEKNVRLQEKDATLRFKEMTFVRDMEALQYALDMTEFRYGARALLEVILPNVWQRVLGKCPPSGASNQLAGLLKEGACPGLLAYLDQAAEDNDVRATDLLRQTGKLCDVLCEPHAEAVGGTTRVPAELLEHSGRTTLLAFAALASFSGRDLSLYRLGNVKIPLKLRKLRVDCSATRAQIRASSLLERNIGVSALLSEIHLQ
jgi:hypothetical protein